MIFSCGVRCDGYITLRGLFSYCSQYSARFLTHCILSTPSLLCGCLPLPAVSPSNPLQFLHSAPRIAPVTWQWSATMALMSMLRSHSGHLPSLALSILIVKPFNSERLSLATKHTPRLLHLVTLVG